MIGELYFVVVMGYYLSAFRPLVLSMHESLEDCNAALDFYTLLGMKRGLCVDPSFFYDSSFYFLQRFDLY